MLSIDVNDEDGRNEAKYEDLLARGNDLARSVGGRNVMNFNGSYLIKTKNSKVLSPGSFIFLSSHSKQDVRYSGP